MKVIVKGLNRIRGLHDERIEVRSIIHFQNDENQIIETGELGDTTIHIILPDNFKEHLGDKGRWINFTDGLEDKEIDNDEFKKTVIFAMQLYVDRQKRILEDADKSI